MADRIWQEETGAGALVAVALHDGHAVRDEVTQLLALDEVSRLREEDPFTATWTAVAPTRVIGLRSRFEIDLNRPRPEAVYRTPEDAWGLQVWTQDLPEDVIARSLAEYDCFYTAMHEILGRIAERHRKFFVFDLHSYNHRRDGPNAAPANQAENPQVNVGTGTMDRSRWAPLVDRFITDLGAYDFPGGRLDVRENVKFVGRGFPRWVHQVFPDSGCALAIEFKKFFMDEWTGQADQTQVEAIGDALRSTVPGILEELDRL